MNATPLTDRVIARILEQARRITDPLTMLALEQQAAKLGRVACERRLQQSGTTGEVTVDLGDSECLRLPGAILTTSGGDRDAVEQFVDEMLRLASVDHGFSARSVAMLREHSLLLFGLRLNEASKAILVMFGTDRIVENARRMLAAIDAGIVDAAGLHRSLRRAS